MSGRHCQLRGAWAGIRSAGIVSAPDGTERCSWAVNVRRLATPKRRVAVAIPRHARPPSP